VASIVKLSLDPRYCPGIRFPKEEKAFLAKYLRGGSDIVLEERYEPGEAPGRAFLESGHERVADFVPIHARIGMCPEARTLIEEFEPGVHQFLPVEVVRPRSKKPIHRLDGRVLDTPYYLFIPQTVLDAIWIERSEVQVNPTYLGPPMVGPRYIGRYNIVLRREMTEGRHVWRGRFHLFQRVIFSDALVRAVDERKLRKPEWIHLEEA
jgi:hypothetical protein